MDMKNFKLMTNGGKMKDCKTKKYLYMHSCIYWRV